MNEKKKKILAVDLGFSSCKCAIRDDFGSLNFNRTINCIAQLPDTLQEIDDDSIFQHLGTYYAVGAPALKMSRSSQLSIETFEDLKKIYPIWISYLAKKYGGEEGFDAFSKIVIGLSLAFANESDGLLDYLYDQLCFPPGEEFRNLFVILPQGVIAKKAIEKYNLNLRDTDAANRNATKLKNYIIVDSGFNSTDCCVIINGKSSMAGAMGLESTGVINICYKIVDYIYQNFGGLKLTLKEAMEIEETGVFIRRRVTYPMQEVVKKFCIEFIIDTLNLIETHFNDELDRVEGIYWIGGGAHIYSKYKNDPEVVKEVTKHFPQSFLITGEEDMEHMNAVSYLTAIEEMIEKGQI